MKLEQRLQEIENTLKKYNFKVSENSTTDLEIELLKISKKLLEKLDIAKKALNYINACDSAIQSSKKAHATLKILENN